SPQILHLDAERSGPARPPATIFSVGARSAAADEMVVLVVDEEVEVTGPITGDARFGQLPAVEYDGIDVGGARLDGVLVGLGLPHSPRPAHRGGLVDQQVGDLVPFGEVAGFGKNRVRRYRMAGLLRTGGLRSRRRLEIDV